MLKYLTSMIFNALTTESYFLTICKSVEVIPLPKFSHFSSIHNDLRLIPFLAELLVTIRIESTVGRPLLVFLESNLDDSQFDQSSEKIAFCTHAVVALLRI